MRSAVEDYLDFRIEDIVKDIRKNNSEFTRSLRRSMKLYDALTRSLSPDELKQLNEMLDLDVMKNGIIEHELYRQGYLDCVSLLCMLGVLK